MRATAMPAAASTLSSRPGGSKGADGKPRTESPFRFDVIARLGKKYLRPHWKLLLLYITGSLLCQTVLPQQAAIFLSDITNHFQEGAGVLIAPGKAVAADEKATARTAPPAGSNPAAPAATAKNSAGLVRTYALWLTLTLGLVALSFGYQCLVSFLDVRTANAVKTDAFAAILRQSPRFFHEHDSDRLTMIVSQYCNLLAAALRQLLVDPILQSVSVIIVGWTIYHTLAKMVANQVEQGVYMWSFLGVNGIWVVFGVIVVFAMFSPWIVGRSAKFLQRDTSAVQAQNLALATLIGGAFKAPEELQAMDAGKLFEEKHAALLGRSLKLQMAQSVSVQKINALGGLPGNVVLAAFLGLAVYLQSADVHGQPATVVQVALLTPILMGAIQRLSNFRMTVSMAWPNVEMVNSMLERKSEIVTRPDAQDVGELASTLEARNLVFSYVPGEKRNVLDGLSFQIPTGSVTGFVARPGQGKTTFFRLALRFYEPQAGTILLGGRSNADLTPECLRRHLALMSQFPAFFYDTTRENFLVAKPDATDDEIRALCEFTGLWSILVDALGPEPLDRPFAAGNLISGGQKKLFALTRCLLRRPTFLFLDEPTTGMGPLEKFPMIDKMRDALSGKTVVVVDHDIIWQARFCDYFLVMNDGKIAQQGTRQELLARPGLFKELYDEASQFSAPLLANP